MGGSLFRPSCLVKTGIVTSERSFRLARRTLVLEVAELESLPQGKERALLCLGLITCKYGDSAIWLLDMSWTLTGLSWMNSTSAVVATGLGDKRETITGPPLPLV